MQKATHIIQAIFTGLALLVSVCSHAQTTDQRTDRLAAEVAGWVARQQNMPTEGIAMAPLDPRLKVRNCDDKWQFEFPFPSVETVKVICKSPSWHLFVRVTLPAHGNKVLGATSPSPEAGRGVQRKKVWVLEAPVQAGAMLNLKQVAWMEREVGVSSPPLLEEKIDLKYYEASRDLPSGAILRQLDLRPMLLVKRGQMVQLTIGQSQGFLISARVEAMQDGRYGEQVKLKNPESGKMLTGVVKAPGLVEGS